MADIYVSPTGSGNKSGSSPENALPVTSLDKAIVLAGAGGSVLMLADKGSYNLTTGINITHGGTAEAPVTVKGVDSLGNEMNIQINGTRMTDYVVGGAAGNECFRLMSGADNLVFENMNFANVATAFRAGADISNIVVQDMYADNVRRFFEDIVSGSNTSATVSGLTIRNVEVHGFSKGVVRLQYDSNNILIENVYGDSERQDGDGIAIGIHLAGTVHGVVIRKVTMDNAQSSTTDYWNGDGFATERGVYDVLFEDTVARGNADGGYDLKSNGTTLVRAVAEGNGRNFRLWGEATLVDCVGIDPHKWGGSVGGQFQIQVMDGANVTVIGGMFSDSGRTTAVAVNDGGGKLTFVDTQFIYADIARLTLGSDIFGIDPARVTTTSATGSYSTNGTALIEAEHASQEPAEPTPSEPTPAEPTPTEPAPAEPTPTEPTPSEPAPSEPTPAEPIPTDPTPSEPTPSEPAPTEPTPTEPGPTEPTPSEPTPSQPIPTEPTPPAPAPAEPVPSNPPPSEPVVLNESMSYFYDIPGGSGHSAVELDSNDMIVTSRALGTARDGLVRLSSDGTLHLEQTRKSVGDQSVTITSVDSLRYLGTSGGKHYYADAAVKPAGATEGGVGNDVLAGTRRADIFFFDTALGVSLGTDAISNFAADDKIMTTRPLFDQDGDGLILADDSQAFLLGSTSDPANQLKVTDAARAAITALQFGGTTVVGDVTYYVYGLTAAAGPAPNPPSTGGEPQPTPTEPQPTPSEPTPTPSNPSPAEPGGGSTPPPSDPVPASTPTSYAYDIPGGSGRTAITVDKNDTLVTNKALYDPNRDGLIDFGPGGTLNLEQTSRSVGDQQVEISGAQGLRFLGTSGGTYYYADAAVKPKAAIESTVANNSLKGTTKADTFFFDTALGIKLGSDAISSFGANDRIVTTKPLFDGDGDGLIAAGAGNAFQLGDTADAANQLKIADASRRAVSTIEFDGTTVVDGVAYYVYSLPGGSADLTI